MRKLRVLMGIVLLVALDLAGLTCGDDFVRWVILAAHLALILIAFLVAVIVGVIGLLLGLGKGPHQTLH